MAEKFWGNVLQYGTYVVGIMTVFPAATCAAVKGTVDYAQSGESGSFDKGFTSVMEGWESGISSVALAAGQLGDTNNDSITSIATSVVGAVAGVMAKDAYGAAVHRKPQSPSA